jgi:methanogenic corrinoid protein MtbC1
MVGKLLRAAGWAVTPDAEPTLENIKMAVSNNWHAVAGVTSSSHGCIESLTKTIAAIRKHSCNPAIGIMVGGPQFLENPGLVERVGADATAVNATTAVILAQKLFDTGAKSNWLGTGPE